MIVVEGPDGSGKTMLAKWIAEEFELDYRRAPTLSSEHGPDDQAVLWFEKQLELGVGEKGVYDRVFIISELIYQLASPGRPLLRDALYMVKMLKLFIRRVDLLIICLPPWEVARQNLQDENRAARHGVGLLALEKIHWAYAYQTYLLKNILGQDVTVYDYTSMNKSHIEEAISESV